MDAFNQIVEKHPLYYADLPITEVLPYLNTLKSGKEWVTSLFKSGGGGGIPKARSFKSESDFDMEGNNSQRKSVFEEVKEGGGLSSQRMLQSQTFNIK